MKFSELGYERPDIKALEESFNRLLKDFNSASTFEKQSEIMEEINALRSGIETMAEIIGIRHTIDTTDKFYEDEQNYLDEVMPIYEGMVSEYYKSIVNSKFRDKLEERWGKQVFNIAELTINTFKPEIIEDLQAENKLSSEYTKLIASAKIDFMGEERNLSGLTLSFNQRIER